MPRKTQGVEEASKVVGAKVESADTSSSDQASLAPKADASPESEEKQITYIDVHDIELGERLRTKINDAAMEELLISIEDIGLINPITVTEKDEKYVLVAGLHRLRAYNNLFQTVGAAYQKVPAIVVDQDKAEDIEICENLFRSDLCVLEKAKHLHKYLSSFKKKKGVTEALTNLAEEFGKSQRTLFDYRKIGEHLKVEKEIMALGTDLKNSTKQLEYLAKKPVDEQKAIMKKLKAEPKLSVRQAYSLVKKDNPGEGEEEKESKSTAPVRISISVRDEIKSLAAELNMEQKAFTEKLLIQAIEAFRIGKISIN